MNTSRTVLITGGTGFVCMNIAEALLSRGDAVVLLARRSPSPELLRDFDTLPGHLEFACGDVTDTSSLVSVIRQYHITDFIHGAAVTPSQEAEYTDPASIMQINCMGVLNALEAARQTCVDRFLYLGSVSGYGQTCFDSDILIEGESLANPHTLYELSKFTGERLVQRYRTLFGMDAALLRVGDVFGPWERKTGVRSFMSFPYQLTAAALRGEHAVLPGQNRIDWVYGRDIGNSVAALLHTTTLDYDAYPLCSGFLWPITDWCRKLAERFPAFSWSIAAPGEMPTIRVNQMQDNAPMQTARLISQTNYRPCYDLDLAFEDYMRWLDAHPGWLE